MKPLPVVAGLHPIDWRQPLAKRLQRAASAAHTPKDVGFCWLKPWHMKNFRDRNADTVRPVLNARPGDVSFVVAIDVEKAEGASDAALVTLVENAIRQVNKRRSNP